MKLENSTTKAAFQDAIADAPSVDVDMLPQVPSTIL